jgi:hypothetical protein
VSRPARARAALVVAAALALAAAACREEIRFDELSACAQDADCLLASMHCNAGKCVACLGDAHCTAPGFPRCDTMLHRCVQCVADQDCGGGGLCRSRRCTTPCTAGCPASAMKCDDLICVQCDDGVGCAGSAAGPVCLEHFCGTCRDDTGCSGATPRCDPVTHACVQCQANADCGATRPLCDIGVGTCVALP